MICYLDTSILVAMLRPEPHTSRVLAWAAAQPQGTLAISPWCMTEFASALALQQRMGRIAEPVRRQAEQSLARLRASLVEVDILPVDFQQAAAYVGTIASGLRAPDALHLAIARRHRATMATSDVVLAAAARATGCAVVGPTAPPPNT